MNKKSVPGLTMDDLSEAIQRQIAQCNYEIAKLEIVQAGSNDVAAQTRLRSAERAVRLSQAYRSGDLPAAVDHATRLLSPSDCLALLFCS